MQRIGLRSLEAQIHFQLVRKGELLEFQGSNVVAVYAVFCFRQLLQGKMIKSFCSKQREEIYR